MKTITKILIVIALILGLGVYIVIDVYEIAPKKYTTRYTELSSENIETQLDGMNILFFSDLDYGTFVNEERLNSLVTKINNLSPDVIIFGGDMYDEAANFSDESNAILSKAFTSLKAPYGKYAVYGDCDERSEEMLQAINSVYASANFEVLNNSSIALHKQCSASITLVGIDNSIRNNQDIQTAYSTVSRDSYVITVCHTPDTALSVPSDITNYFLAGHSHGGQAYYFFGALYEPEGAKEYLRGTQRINDSFTLDITNGVGTTKKDVRFLANAEVVMYTLKSEEKPTPTVTPTPTASPTETTATEETPAEEQSQQEDTQAEQPTE